MPDVFVSDSVDKDGPENPIPLKVPTKESEKVKVAGHSHNLFGSFRLYPEKTDFESRTGEEKIILLLRQHPIVNFKWIVISILMFLVPSVLGFLGLLSQLPANLTLVGIMGWYLVCTSYVLENFINWFFNVYILTTKRIVDVDFHNLIYKQVSDTYLDNIQDVTYKMGGVVRTVFNYGDVFIQTAAEVSEFEYLAVPSPDRVARIIQEVVGQSEEGGK